MAASRTLSRSARTLQNELRYGIANNASRRTLSTSTARYSGIALQEIRYTRSSFKPYKPQLSQWQRQKRHQSTNYATPAPTIYTASNPGKTALYDLHLEYGAKMVEFGGYNMPVSYSDLGVGESHAWTRERASLFDVGHMVQYHVEGPGAEAFLESLTPAGLKDLATGHNGLSTLLHPQTGGIVDDCIITRLEPGPQHLFYLVTNAGCREKDYGFLSSALQQWNDNTINPVAHLRHLQNDVGQSYGLIALQGPLSAQILKNALHPACRVDIDKWYFGSAKYITLSLPSGGSKGESQPIVASRGGYTGEDGFELSIPPSQTVDVTRALLNSAGPDKLRFAGLGARDSLRLEAGMCLYGHDLDDSTTPVEAALAWIIPKSRRTVETSGFNGAETIIPQLTPKPKGGTGVSRRRVGLTVDGAPAREGAVIVNAEGTEVGKVTSGCPSPTLKRNIAMGYVKDGLHKSGTELAVVVRGKQRKAVVTKMPFVPSKYWKGGVTPG